MKFSHILLIAALGVFATFNVTQPIEQEIEEQEEPMIRKGPMTQEERYARRSEPISIEQKKQSDAREIQNFTSEQKAKADKKKKRFSWK